MGYLGQSAAIDILICAGLGAAIVACVLTNIQLVIGTEKSRSPQIGVAFRILVFLVYGGAQFAVVAVIGSTKTIRHEDSILGFVGGGVLAVAVSLFQRTFKKK
jgi:hypothetical protein